ncbi:MAG: RNA methyltransferase [Prochloron sp. SP5CPC1]|nr:RNA methyltransferase [Candidatus Paraprochloron terpiosi SP5CPC1]
MSTNERPYLATVARGLEPIAAQELESLGVKNVRPDFTVVHFLGHKILLYRVNLWARTIFRVLMPIKEIKCSNREELYKNVNKIPWKDYLEPNNTLAVNCTGGNKNLNHSHFTALEIKNAIVDQQRTKTGKRSHIDTENPDILINAHINAGRCILSLDSSGSSLHRRGYHQAMGLAPLKESLAAALLHMAKWEPTIPFLDPLCGSGILPLEAALKGLNIAPGLYRQRFGFETWKDFDPTLWQKIKTDAQDSQLSELKAPIFGSDRDSNMIRQARSNAQNCSLDSQIQFSLQELSQIEAPTDSGIIICNPPYGKRIGSNAELGDFYKLLSDVLKQRFKGWIAYVLMGNKELGKRIRLRTSRRIPVYNGSLPCTLLKYELY